MRKHEKLEKILRFIYVIAVICLLYFPIFIIVVLSFDKDQTGQTWGGFTLKWYAEIFMLDRLRTSILNTFAVALCTTIISSVAGTFIAIGINNLSKKKKKYMMLC